MKARGPHGEYPRVIFGIDFDALPDLLFPIEKAELEAITKGSRHDAVIPVPRKASLGIGDKVTFLESTADPFGSPSFVPQGDAVRVTVTNVRDEQQEWAGRKLYYIAWDPARIEASFQRGTGVPR